MSGAPTSSNAATSSASKRSFSTRSSEDGQLKAFRQARAQDYNLLLVREATANGNVVPQLLDAVTQREVAADRMAEDDEQRILADQGVATVAPQVP